MQPWEYVVTVVLSAGGGGLIYKLGESLIRRGADVAKTGIKAHGRSKVKRIELTGDAQKDIAKLAERMYNDSKDSHDEIIELSAKIANLETAKNALEFAMEGVKKQRDIAIQENVGFIREITKLVEQSKTLTEHLAKRESEYALLALEHEGAKARIAKYEETIAEMKQFIDESNAEKAQLESELERAKARG